MLTAKGRAMSEARVSVKSINESLAITDLKSNPFWILWTGTLYIAYVARKPRSAKKVLDVGSISAGFVLRAAWLWLLLLRSCRVLRNSSAFARGCLLKQATHFALRTCI
jgi:hypothetical protein